MKVRVIETQGKLDGTKTIISYLSGSDNENDFTGFAFYFEETDRIAMWKKFANNSDLRMDAETLLMDPMGAGERYAMESGNCFVCNRKLTVPISLKRGMGPECASKYGMA